MENVRSTFDRRDMYRGTSPIRERPTPEDPLRTLGMPAVGS